MWCGVGVIVLCEREMRIRERFSLRGGWWIGGWWVALIVYFGGWMMFFWERFVTDGSWGYQRVLDLWKDFRYIYI